MKFLLADYIEKYIQEADDSADKTTALHLKEIIPKTTHLDKKVFNQIIEELKTEVDKGKDFRFAFQNVCEKYILKGDFIAADLPGVLTRVILNESKFFQKIAKNRAVPIGRKEIKEIIHSKHSEVIEEILGVLMLSLKGVVFATFNESNMEADPFISSTLKDIVNMLALDTSMYKKDQPQTAVSIRYKNREDISKRFPVFTDAGWYDKFYPSDKSDKYGRTKSLDPSLKNMPEVVHENLKLADVIVDIHFLEEK